MRGLGNMGFWRMLESVGGVGVECRVGGVVVFFFQAGDGIRGDLVTGGQTCALPI